MGQNGWRGGHSSRFYRRAHPVVASHDLEREQEGPAEVLEIPPRDQALLDEVVDVVAVAHLRTLLSDVVLAVASQHAPEAAVVYAHRVAGGRVDRSVPPAQEVHAKDGEEQDREQDECCQVDQRFAGAEDRDQHLTQGDGRW